MGLQVNKNTVGNQGLQEGQIRITGAKTMVKQMQPKEGDPEDKMYKRYSGLEVQFVPIDNDGNILADPETKFYAASWEFFDKQSGEGILRLIPCDEKDEPVGAEEGTEGVGLTINPEHPLKQGQRPFQDDMEYVRFIAALQDCGVPEISNVEDSLVGIEGYIHTIQLPPGQSKDGKPVPRRLQVFSKVNPDTIPGAKKKKTATGKATAPAAGKAGATAAKPAAGKKTAEVDPNEEAGGILTTFMTDSMTEKPEMPWMAVKTKLVTMASKAQISDAAKAILSDKAQVAELGKMLAEAMGAGFTVDGSTVTFTPAE